MGIGRSTLAAAVLACGMAAAWDPAAAQDEGAGIQLGPRPFYLVDRMPEGELKSQLQQCRAGPFARTDFSIGHRGAPLMFPEHTEKSYRAAALMGAGIVECDVTFTKDRELVCRHSQCDLHTTTNILAVPELAAKCSEPFSPADPANGREASANCCTSDITLAEFKTLTGKMDAYDKTATTVEAFMGGTADWRTELYATSGTLMTHAESIDLLKDLGVKFTPELKAASVAMPYEGDYTQEDYAQQMIDEYKAAGVPASDVFAQSFNLDDVRYWLANEPEFGAQAVFLDDRDATADLDPLLAETLVADMRKLAEEGVNILAPPMWMLMTLDADGKIVPSPYAEAAKEAGLDLIAWSFERSGTLTDGGGYYYQSIADVVDEPGVMMEVLDVLAQDVGVRGMFSDWPATVSYYASCMGLD
jgi:glycerophosphoryl diester phosphodiesterase